MRAVWTVLAIPLVVALLAGALVLLVGTVGLSVWMGVMVGRGELPAYALVGLFPVVLLLWAAVSQARGWD